MQRPAIRPFSGRAITQAEPATFSYAPARPFSFTGARPKPEVTTSVATRTPVRSPTPLWTVAVYEPGLEQVASRADEGSAADDIVEASLALAEDVVEAGRHATSQAAAEVLEVVALRLRRGAILLAPGASTSTDTAVISAVLAALLGGRH